MVVLTSEAPPDTAAATSQKGKSALNRLPLTDLASVAPLGVGGAVCAVGAPTGKSSRPSDQSRPTFGLGGASEREREDLHPSMRTCAVRPVGLAAGLRLCLESWRGSSDRRPLCVPAGASPALGRGVAATRRASAACSTPNRACRGSRSSAASKGSQEAGRVALNPRAAHSPLSGSLTSREFVNPSPSATTLKDVTPSAGESTAVNGRGGIAQGVRGVEGTGSSFNGFNRGPSDRRLFTQLCGGDVVAPRRGSESLLDVTSQ